VISRVAVLPQPPLLVPELVGGDDVDAAAVRAACVAVAKDLVQVAPRWLAVGVGERSERIESAAGTFRGFGVDVRVELGPGAAERVADVDLPLPALVAGWLRGQVGATEVAVELVPANLPTDECVATGARLASGDEPVGLLVLGDGSHRHGDRAIGRPDARAGSFDESVAAAFAQVDLDALLALDPTEADELGAVGRAPWQVLVGAVRADGRSWRRVRSSVQLPFGVAYHFAVWEPVA
jgi:hypothetical protein